MTGRWSLWMFPLPLNAALARSDSRLWYKVRKLANIEDVRLLEWAPGVGQFQAADLTGLWSCSSSKRLGLR